MGDIAWYLNGTPEAEVAHGAVTPGQYLGHLWVENRSDRPLRAVMLSDKHGRAMFSPVVNGPRDYSLCLGSINPGGRGSAHAWVTRVAMEGPIQIIAEEEQ